MFRTGLGFDNHRLAAGRPLVLGGVEIPAPVGEVAHSDGDVLIHALCDAIYGAVGRGDIGEHFPDTEAKWKGAPSLVFLEHALGTAKERGYRVVNVDATVFLEKVKLSPHKARIAESLRRAMAGYWELEADAVNVKAKTAEGCDAVGRGEAIAAAVAVLLLREAP
jgi:2-C-methyl-D-erythritol 2,4-cyclodiphosphate synthase